MAIASSQEFPPINNAALTVLTQLAAANYQAYLVGGCVRDALLDEAPKDWDIATSALPEQVVELSMKLSFRVIPSGLKHGTVTILVDGQPIEVTTFRSDGAYRDNRHPANVRFVSTIEDDLARRDFTINALAFSPYEGLIDPFGGASDLSLGILRAVGDPATRVGEDALRIMRALRFAAAKKPRGAIGRSGSGYSSA